MITDHDYASQPPADFIRNLMNEEMNAIEFYSQQAARAGDPALRWFFQKLAEMRLKCYDELETKLLEIKSQSEITGQINAMFG